MKVRAVETDKAQLCIPIRVPPNKNELNFLTLSSWLSLILFVLIRVHSWFYVPLRVLCVSVVKFLT